MSFDWNVFAAACFCRKSVCWKQQNDSFAEIWVWARVRKQEKSVSWENLENPIFRRAYITLLTVMENNYQFYSIAFVFPHRWYLQIKTCTSQCVLSWHRHVKFASEILSLPSFGALSNHAAESISFWIESGKIDFSFEPVSRETWHFKMAPNVSNTLVYFFVGSPSNSVCKPETGVLRVVQNITVFCSTTVHRAWFISTILKNLKY